MIGAQGRDGVEVGLKAGPGLARDAEDEVDADVRTAGPAQAAEGGGRIGLRPPAERRTQAGYEALHAQRDAQAAAGRPARVAGRHVFGVALDGHLGGRVSTGSRTASRRSRRRGPRSDGVPPPRKTRAQPADAQSVPLQPPLGEQRVDVPVEERAEAPPCGSLGVAATGRRDRAGAARLADRHGEEVAVVAAGAAERDVDVEVPGGGVRERRRGGGGRGRAGRRRPAARLPAAGRVHYFSLPSVSISSTARKASCGTSTLPSCFIRFLPSFCFSSSLRLRVMSPP